MTIFVTNGDAPLSAAQLDKRTQAYIDRDWPQWERERSIRNNDGLFNAYMSTVSDDTDANRDNNIFNQQLVDYRQAVTRLEKYRLADGKPEQSFEVPTGEFDPETGEEIVETSIVPAIEPLEATVEQPVYDELTGEQTGTETVPNPLIVNDDTERAAAQAIVDATPQEVKDFE